MAIYTFSYLVGYKNVTREIKSFLFIIPNKLINLVDKTLLQIM